MAESSFGHSVAIPYIPASGVVNTVIHFPEDTRHDNASLDDIDFRLGDLSDNLEVCPDVGSGILGLDENGITAGSGVYYSPVVDLGEVFEFTTVHWEAIEPSGLRVDMDNLEPKTIEVRFHDYQPPLLNTASGNWTNLDLPSPIDGAWGDPGSISWQGYENGIAETAVDIRYIQWRARLTSKAQAVTTEYFHLSNIAGSVRPAQPPRPVTTEYFNLINTADSSKPGPAPRPVTTEYYNLINVAGDESQ